MAAMPNRLKAIREAKGLTQQALADLVGTTKQQISNLENSRRKLSEDWLRRLSSKLGVTAGAIIGEDASYPQIQPEGVIAAPKPMIESWPRDVPVLGTSAAGDVGDFMLNGDVIDWARRPPVLRGVNNAFCVYIQGESMVPWRQPGGLVYVHPSRPPRTGDHVVVELHAPDGEPKPAFCKLLIRSTPKALILGQYNPKRDDIAIPQERVLHLYRVMDWEELLA